ncbi:transcriptional regulator, partial [Fischerella thermalis CCMEE 5273]
IVELLRDGPLSVGEITDRLGLRQPQVSKHLRVLDEAGLVEVRPVANRRIYQLKSETFQQMDAWMESYRCIWDERLNRLDHYLQEIQRKDVDDNNKP